jgi:hypothetical protein
MDGFARSGDRRRSSDSRGYLDQLVEFKSTYRPRWRSNALGSPRHQARSRLGIRVAASGQLPLGTRPNGRSRGNCDAIGEVLCGASRRGLRASLRTRTHRSLVVDNAGRAQSTRTGARLTIDGKAVSVKTQQSYLDGYVSERENPRPSLEAPTRPSDRLLCAARGRRGLGSAARSAPGWGR